MSKTLKLSIVIISSLIMVGITLYMDSTTMTYQTFDYYMYGLIAYLIISVLLLLNAIMQFDTSTKKIGAKYKENRLHYATVFIYFMSIIAIFYIIENGFTSLSIFIAVLMGSIVPVLLFFLTIHYRLDEQGIESKLLKQKVIKYADIKEIKVSGWMNCLIIKSESETIYLDFTVKGFIDLFNKLIVHLDSPLYSEVIPKLKDYYKMVLQFHNIKELEKSK